jgi:hypothetical protein
LVPVSVVVGSWLVDVVSSVVFDALNGQADAAPAKASNVTSPRTSLRTMIRPSPLIAGLIFHRAHSTPGGPRGEALF